MRLAKEITIRQVPANPRAESPVTIDSWDSISSLAYGSSTPVPTGMSVPANYPPGAAYLGMFVDEFNQVPGECKENNNTIAIPVEVVPGS